MIKWTAKSLESKEKTMNKEKPDAPKIQGCPGKNRAQIYDHPIVVVDDSSDSSDLKRWREESGFMKFDFFPEHGYTTFAL